MGCFQSCLHQEETGYLYIKVPEEIANELHGWGLSNIPDSQLGPKPKFCETRPEPWDYHVTLAVSVQQAAFKSLGKIKMPGLVHITLGKLSTFDSPDREVVTIAVEPSDDLKELQDKVMVSGGNNIAKPRHETWHPHMTIAFAKSGLSIGTSLKSNTARESQFEGKSWEVDNFVFHIGGKNPQTEEIVFHQDTSTTPLL